MKTVNNMYPDPDCFKLPKFMSNNMYDYCSPCFCPYYAGVPIYDSEYYREFADECDLDYIDDKTEYDLRSDSLHVPNSADSIENTYDNNFNNTNIPGTLRDYGPEPYVVNIAEATIQNDYFRRALWTGNHLQVTLMSIEVGGEIGLEIHPNVDQFLRIEEGQGVVKIGKKRDMLDFQMDVYDDAAILIPAGTWHNVINTGNTPLKLYSIYAPPQHPRGTVHETKADAEAAEMGIGH